MVTTKDLKIIAEKVGVDCKNLPNNLETTICRAILTKLGYDCSKLQDNLTSTMLKEIGDLLEGGAGGGSGIIEVEEFPTENIKEDTIYQVNEVSDIDVLFSVGEIIGNFESAIKYLGVTPNVTYYLINELPTSPNISDLVAFTSSHVYIMNDIPYVYANADNGETWLPLNQIISSYFNTTLENKGYVDSTTSISETGVYVTYKLGKRGILNQKYGLCEIGDFGYLDYKDYKAIFDKTIKEFSNSNVITVPDYAFACTNLVNIDLLNATKIGVSAFLFNYSLKNINIPNVVKIDNGAFYGCHDLESIYLPKIQEFMSNALGYCESLKAIIINQTNVVCETQGIILNGCSHILGEQNDSYNPNGDKDGYIYVPDSMVEQYKVHESWKDYATQIKPISELPQEYKDKYGI